MRTKPRYSSAFEQDWLFYSNSTEIFKFCGKRDSDIVSNIEPDPNGSSAKECFLALDSRGKTVPCSEPDLLLDILRTKAAVNWQIRQWAEMLASGVLFLPELEECKNIYQLPAWVLDGVHRQAAKLGWPKSSVINWNRYNTGTNNDNE